MTDLTHSTTGAATHRPNRVRAAVAAVLLILGLLLPWNVYFGLGITGTLGWVFVLLVVVTLASLAALVVGSDRKVGRRTAEAPDRSSLRLVLNLPYLILVAAFTLFTIVNSIRYGGTGVVAPGVGPGAWVGLAGALLAAQPAIRANGDKPHGTRAGGLIGWLSIVLALLAALANLYFRTRFVVSGIGGEANAANLATAVVALLYSMVALAPVLIAGRWIISGNAASRLATLLLGASALVAGALLWILPVGRDLDAFHGIAQNTGTAGVGYEGYLAWVAAAAIVGTAALHSALAANSAELWHNAARLCLLLIAAWCGGLTALRIVGIALTSVLDLPGPPYNSTALMAFDLITALVAGWLIVNGTNRAAPRAVTAVLFGVLFVLTVCRLIVGVALVPRSLPLNPGTINAVFGNQLTQQITSTFDVTLAVLAALVLAGVLAFDLWPRRTPPTPATERCTAQPVRPPVALHPGAVAPPRIAPTATARPRIAGPPKPDEKPQGRSDSVGPAP